MKNSTWKTTAGDMRRGKPEGRGREWEPRQDIIAKTSKSKYNVGMPKKGRGSQNSRVIKTRRHYICLILHLESFSLW